MPVVINNHLKSYWWTGLVEEWATKIFIYVTVDNYTELTVINIQYSGVLGMVHVWVPSLCGHSQSTNLPSIMPIKPTITEKAINNIGTVSSCTGGAYLLAGEPADTCCFNCRISSFSCKFSCLSWLSSSLSCCTWRYINFTLFLCTFRYSKFQHKQIGKK